MIRKNLLFFFLVYSLLSFKINAFNGMNIRFFEEGHTKAYFKMNAQFMEHSLSGLLIIKQMHAGEYRLVLTMETGIKVFDISIFPQKLKWHEAMPMYANPFVKKIIRKDLQLLLHRPFTEENSLPYGEVVREIKWKYLYSKQDENTLEKKRHKKKNAEMALKRINEQGLILQSEHTFGNTPYSSFYQRIPINP